MMESQYNSTSIHVIIIPIIVITFCNPILPAVVVVPLQQRPWVTPQNFEINSLGDDVVKNLG